ncbi:MAG: ImmA/IrrE family metallo-endopeptidase [Alphaproteobacteria bacterium]
MSNQIINEYIPEIVSPPGETLQDILDDRDMTQAELAERMGRPKKTICEIIKGKAQITPDTAIQLEHVLGIPASFWSNREWNYRQYLSRIALRERLKENICWLQEFPIREMIARGWLSSPQDKVRRVVELLIFFGVDSPAQWHEVYKLPQASYRMSSAVKTNPGALSVWLRKGEIEAQKINCAPYEENKFKKALKDVKVLTKEKPDVFRPRLISLCASAGVAVVFIKGIPGAPVSGAARWITPTKALIQLSLRYKTDDQLWFTFFHEAGHLLLHGKKRIFIEVDEHVGAEEEKANKFAADFLIPPNEFSKLKGKQRISSYYVREIAKQIGVAPGIVVGRLQHEKIIPMSWLNKLKRRYEWKS